MGRLRGFRKDQTMTDLLAVAHAKLRRAGIDPNDPALAGIWVELPLTPEAMLRMANKLEKGQLRRADHALNPYQWTRRRLELIGTDMTNGEEIRVMLDPIVLFSPGRFEVPLPTVDPIRW